jgi:hypothetical protein
MAVSKPAIRETDQGDDKSGVSDTARVLIEEHLKLAG